MGEYEVRPPRLDEAAECARVHVRVWREAYAGLMRPEALADLDPATRVPLFERVARGGLPEGDELFVAVHRPDDGARGSVVGMVSAGPGRDDDAPTALELRAINVLAAHHGTGVAQRLLDRAVGDRPAYLWVVEGNERAQAFYRRNGFRIDGGRKRDVDLGVDEVRMSR